MMNVKLTMARRVRHALLGALLFFGASPLLADYAAEWGPKVGTALPAIAAPDQDGSPRTLADLQGENGVLILFNRSADW